MLRTADHMLGPHRQTDTGSQRLVFPWWSPIQVLTEVDVTELQWRVAGLAFGLHHEPYAEQIRPASCELQ